jgi:hypothetical protein
VDGGGRVDLGKTGGVSGKARSWWGEEAAGRGRGEGDIPEAIVMLCFVRIKMLEHVSSILPSNGDLSHADYVLPCVPYTLFSNQSKSVKS